MGKGEKRAGFLVGKPSVTRPLGWHMYRRENNNKMDLQEKGGDFA